LGNLLAHPKLMKRFLPGMCTRKKKWKSAKRSECRGGCQAKHDPTKITGAKKKPTW